MLIFVGDTTPIVVNVTDDLNAPIDLTSVASATMNYERGANDLVTLTGTATTPLAGELTFTTSVGDFTVPGMFVYDIEVVYTNGTKQTLGKASMQVEGTVTNP